MELFSAEDNGIRTTLVGTHLREIQILQTDSNPIGLVFQNATSIENRINTSVPQPASIIIYPTSEIKRFSSQNE